ncbi:beta-ketoacyl synthase chain length factor [Thiomicrorhabdus cannonii]|uniref:beta-ketoacyl synthase chain length factor n=1 Tax=Thiomicrorhabdus cannonii TaxID=2748011 RepID=UPI0015BF079E|nr:beta-ketoacyl synthase chain length factor [Thiomicrorhabdus cannonii]
MIAYIDSVSVQAPGMEGWEPACAVLRGEQPYEFAPLSKYAPAFLPANERRRTTDTIKLALRTAEACTADYADDAIAAMLTLFASVDGDTAISAQMTTAILEDEPMISPIQFHNSVHNAPAGYWMIGKGNRQAASAISAGDYQLANSLLEGLSQLDANHPQLLLVAYDLPIDPVIETFQPKIEPFAFGMVLSAQPSPRCLAKIQLSLVQQPSEVTSHPLFGDNRAAQIWPLLASLARHQNGLHLLPLSNSQSLQITLEKR